MIAWAAIVALATLAVSVVWQTAVGLNGVAAFLDAYGAALLLLAWAAWR